MFWLWFIVSSCMVLFAYHHFVYPCLIQYLAKGKIKAASAHQQVGKQAKIGIVMCAYNEQAYMREKLDNLAMLDYPSSLFAIHVGLDGCTDNTESIVDNARADLISKRVECHKHVFKHNRGKVKTLNEMLALIQDKYDILVFTDVSALLSMDALQKVAEAFSQPRVGVVSGDYQMFNCHLPNQQQYWVYQNKLKRAEGALGAVIGVPGAMFAIRAELVEPLPENTINDDFVMPMRALEKGYEAVVDGDLGIVEMESDDQQQELQRRLRIGAGNLQQLWLLRGMLSPANGWKAFNFLCGKGLRALMPVVLAIGVFATAALAIADDVVAQSLLAVAAFSLLFPLILKRYFGVEKMPILSSFGYLCVNYFCALVGIGKWLLGHYASSWKRDSHSDKSFIPLSVRIMKRTMDITLSAIGLVALSPVMLMVALLVKMASPGPVIYRQWRVGRASPSYVCLFHIYKFRTMVVNAEQLSGAVWAQDNDPRITRVGRFLRKTRLDELPQLWNVLKGDMSLIGPRPERPDFHAKLEFSIPFFCERTNGLRPGISGLAQTRQGYPNDIDGMRQKLAWDMAYTLNLASPWRWLKTEFAIILATLKVIVLAKGQ